MTSGNAKMAHELEEFLKLPDNTTSIRLIRSTGVRLFAREMLVLLIVNLLYEKGNNVFYWNDKHLICHKFPYRFLLQEINSWMNDKSLYEAIFARYSVRKYLARAIEKEKLDQVLNFAPNRLADVEVKFIPVDGKTMRDNLETIFGKVFNAPLYFVMVASEKPHFMLETGYQGEQAVLSATASGLGTCWIGGLFDENKVRTALNIAPALRVIIVSPLGYPSTGVADSFVGGLIRRAGGSVQRMPMREIVFMEEYGNPLESFSGEYSRWDKVSRLSEWHVMGKLPALEIHNSWKLHLCAFSSTARETGNEEFTVKVRIGLHAA